MECIYCKQLYDSCTHIPRLLINAGTPFVQNALNPYLMIACLSVQNAIPIIMQQLLTIFQKILLCWE